MLGDVGHAKTETFFRRVIEDGIFGKHIHLVVVSHLVDSAIPYLPLLAEYYNLRAIYAKPSSIHREIRKQLLRLLPEGVRVETLDRGRFQRDPSFIVDDVFVENSPAPGAPVVLVDIGGYFAHADDSPEASGPQRIAAKLSEKGYRLAGIVEDTQNGHKRYANIPPKQLPQGVALTSVAQSPLKGPENHLVGVAVTFSIEAILRKSNVVLQSRRAGVIGFGPIGMSVAHTLRNRGIPVRVCEIDSIRQAQAAAEGFHVHNYSDDFASFANDLTLIVSATGAGAHLVKASGIPSTMEIDEVLRPTRSEETQHFALNGSSIRLLESGCFVASVTSADDEIDIPDLQKQYEFTEVSGNSDLTRLSERQPDLIGHRGPEPHHVYLMLGGNAVNFLHHGVVGPAIELLQGEIIGCIQAILTGEGIEGAPVGNLSDRGRRAISDKWLDQYLVENMRASGK